MVEHIVTVAHSNNDKNICNTLTFACEKSCYHLLLFVSVLHTSYAILCVWNLCAELTLGSQISILYFCLCKSVP